MMLGAPMDHAPVEGREDAGKTLFGQAMREGYLVLARNQYGHRPNIGFFVGNSEFKQPSGAGQPSSAWRSC